MVVYTQPNNPSVLTTYGQRYDNKRRLASYWHQVDECRRLGGKSVLVVGIATGLSALMLQHAGFDVTTLDIDHQLMPDVTGDVCHIPFPPQAFDLVVCCQVLEHMPFEQFNLSLRELYRVARIGAILSLPDRGAFAKMIPRLIGKKNIMCLPNLKLKPCRDKDHCWEVNTPGYPIAHIENTIQSVGWHIERTYRVWETPYHRFWQLRRTA